MTAIATYKATSADGDRYTLQIVPDDNAESPRTANDNVGKMVCWHPRLRLGDEHEHRTGLEFLQALADELDVEIDSLVRYENKIEYLLGRLSGRALIIPLYIYDHGGVTMSTKPFSCAFDSGRVGWIYATREQINREWNGDWEKARQYLNSEVEDYDRWLRGEAYGFRLIQGDCPYCGTVIDSCYGFHSADLKESGILDHLPDGLEWEVAS